MARIALIDGDEVAYKVALRYQQQWYGVYKDDLLKWKCKLKEEAVESVGNRTDLEITPYIEPLDPKGYEDNLDLQISSIISGSQSTDIKVYLSGSNNFRYALATLQSYKGQASRDDSTKPFHLAMVRDEMKKRGAEFIDFLEADDCMSAYQTILSEETIICSSDKDLRTVHGLNYNIGKSLLTTISKEEADYNFFYQLLMGDATDNIPSPFGLGEVGAKKFLEPFIGKEPKEYYNNIVAFYLSYLVKKGKDGAFKTKWYSKDMDIHKILWEIGNLLYMHRTLEPDERWSING